MMNDGMYSSNTDLWATPQEFFNKLNDEFLFDIDVCANDDNHKCNVYFTKEMNGLTKQWLGTCWMNPPYGREINIWMKKAYEESKRNHNTIVCLVPARTDTRWWHDYAMKGEIRLVKGRLKFNDKGAAPFPSAVVIFGNDRKNNIKVIEN